MPRTKAYDREEVLWNAVELFWEKGFHGTSVADLVEHLGINRASLYEAFGDKHSLFLEALETYRKDQADPQEQLGPDFDLPAFLRSFMDQILLDICRQGGAKGCFIVNSSIDLAPHDEQVRSIVRLNMDDFVERFGHLFSHAQKMKQLSGEKDPKALARFLYNNLNGMRVLARTGVDSSTLEDIAHIALKGILE